MRLTLALAAASVALPAAAQTADLDRLRLQQLQEQNIRLQEQSLQAGRTAADLNQAVAAQVRAQTRANLQATAPPPMAPVPAADDAWSRLQARELDASNARLKAITPAR